MKNNLELKEEIEKIRNEELIDSIQKEDTYFYIRVSSVDQQTIRQEVKAKELGIPLQNVFIEKASGKNIKDRPILEEMLRIIEKKHIESNGKIKSQLIVDSISRFARNTKDLLNLIDRLKESSTEFKSIKEAVDTNTPTGRFMLTVFGAVAELERAYIKDRQMEGIAEAKKQGVYKGRKPIEKPKNWDKYYTLYKEGHVKASEMMTLVGMKKSTFYKMLQQEENAE